MDAPQPPTRRPHLRCCGIDCIPESVSIRQNNRSLRIFSIGSILMFVVALGLVSCKLYLTNMNVTGRVTSTVIVFISFMLPVFLHLFGFKWCFRCILKRKRLIFRTQDSVNLSTALDNLQQYLLDEDKLASVERQAIQCVQGLIQKLSNMFHSDVELRLTGGTAERFAVPLSSQWIDIEGDIDDNHALISDFDFMLQLSQINSSFQPHEDLIVDTHGCPIGYSRMRVNNRKQSNELSDQMTITYLRKM